MERCQCCFRTVMLSRVVDPYKGKRVGLEEKVLLPMVVKKVWQREEGVRLDDKKRG